MSYVIKYLLRPWGPARCRKRPKHSDSTGNRTGEVLRPALSSTLTCPSNTPLPRSHSSMTFKQHLNLHVLSCALLLLSATGVTAQEPFDCKISSDGLSWDLTKLAGEHTVSRERETPPTKFRDDIRFNLCEDLTRKDDAADKDQVSSPVGGSARKRMKPYRSKPVSPPLPLLVLSP